MSLRVVLAQRLGRLADLALARQEHQDVALAALARDLVHGLGDRLGHVHRLVVVLLGLEELRPVAHLHRIGAARHLDHRRAVEELREALGIDRGRGHDHLELGTRGDEALHVPQQEIDVEAALVRLVDDDRVVGAQLAVGVGLGEQDRRRS